MRVRHADARKSISAVTAPYSDEDTMPVKRGPGAKFLANIEAIQINPLGGEA